MLLRLNPIVPVSAPRHTDKGMIPDTSNYIENQQIFLEIVESDSWTRLPFTVFWEAINTKERKFTMNEWKKDLLFFFEFIFVFFKKKNQWREFIT